MVYSAPPQQKEYKPRPCGLCFGQGHITCLWSAQPLLILSPSSDTFKRRFQLLRCHISILPAQSLPSTQELRVLTPFSLTQVTKISHFFK